jgi:hypothetical protein
LAWGGGCAPLLIYSFALLLAPIESHKTLRMNQLMMMNNFLIPSFLLLIFGQISFGPSFHVFAYFGIFPKKSLFE